MEDVLERRLGVRRDAVARDAGVARDTGRGEYEPAGETLVVGTCEYTMWRRGTTSTCGGVAFGFGSNASRSSSNQMRLVLFVCDDAAEDAAIRS